MPTDSPRARLRGARGTDPHQGASRRLCSLATNARRHAPPLARQLRPVAAPDRPSERASATKRRGSACER